MANRSLAAAEAEALPVWTLVTGLSRVRHLPAVLGIVDRLGVRVPADIPALDADLVQAARHAAERLMARCGADRGIPVVATARMDPRPPAFPEPPPLTAEQALAEAMVGYDHDLGEAPGASAPASMIGHDGAPQGRT